MATRMLILAALLWPFHLARATEAVVVASYLNVRNANGSILCAVPDGTKVEATGRDAEDGRVQVRFGKLPKSCPSEAQGAFVSGTYLAPAGHATKESATVYMDGLGLFSKPVNAPANNKCSLAKDTVVRIVDKKFSLSDDTPWIEVRLDPPRPGCPATGFVLKDLLEVKSPFQSLPVVNIGDGDKSDCCTNHSNTTPPAVKNLNQLSGQIGKKIAEGDKHPKAPRTSKANAKVEALARAAKAAASKYRLYAPFVCRRRGMSYPCQGTADPNYSKGWCLQGVSEAFRQTFGYSIPGGSATASKPFLDKNFTRLAVHSCKEAPRGAICLYDRRPVHNFGHIEIKADENSYCSDFCKATPLRVGKFVGAYLPPAGGK